ncbi:MAG TPA: phosphoribosylanthranilate isomerase [Desulfomonilia bacterium]
MWVKICGLTRRDDAMAAVGMGADAVGFVLTKMSRKYADPAEVSGWVAEIRGVEKVGVFYDERPQQIMDIAAKLGLDTIQIHSTVTEEYISLSKKYRIIAAIKDAGSLHYKNERPDTGEVLMGLSRKEYGAKTYMPVRILIDPSMGSGIRAEWRTYPFPFLLAGGLSPDNVREAILKAGPAGVDVSSGVEISPGIKDVSLIEKFILEARS